MTNRGAACPPRGRSVFGDAERLGRLLLSFAPVLLLLTVPPALVGIVTGDGATGWPLVPAAGIAAWLYWVSRRVAVPTDAALIEDALAVALIFPIAVLFSSAPYLAQGLGPLDTLFEGMSGITSTGLTRFGDIGSQPYGLTFLRAWQEWVGGYAIITLTVALLPRFAGAAKRMAESDVADDGGEPIDLKARARWVTLTYVGLTIACIVAVAFCGQTIGFAVLHGLTAISTGGFAGQNDSLAGESVTVVVILSVFMILGAAALSDFVRPWTEGRGLLKLGAVLGGLVGLTVLWGGLILWAEGGALSPYAAFQLAVSAQTTTGFSVSSVADLSDGAKLALSGAMAIGGDAGSTAGGLKLIRVAALVFLLLALLRGAKPGAAPRTDDAEDGWRLLRWWGAASLVGWPLLMLAGAPPVDALFEWLSALNTVGLSVGVSGGDASASTRLILIFGMWIGRVDVFGALLALRVVHRLSPRGAASG